MHRDHLATSSSSPHPPPITTNKLKYMATDRHGKKRVKDDKSEQQPARGAVPATKPSPAPEPSTKRRKASKRRRADHATAGVVVPLQDEIVDESWSCGAGEASGAVRRPPGLFEFPWQKGGRLLIPELDGSDLRDVFFSSLVDGCSAAIGIPGDRLTARPGLVGGLPEIGGLWPSDAEADGADCVWGSIVRQRPLAPAAGGRRQGL